MSLAREGGDAVLEVTDTDIGVPDHEIPRLFDRFHRVESTHGRTHEGSGIGLALVQELVRLHGGSIDVTSKLGVGTTFRVRIPFGTAHIPADRMAAPSSLASTATSAQTYVQEALRWLPEGNGNGAAKAVALTEAQEQRDQRFASTFGARVLLADDNSDMRTYVRDLFSPMYDVEAVADGAQALEAATATRWSWPLSGMDALERIGSFHPDVALLDIGLPGIDGYEVARRIRGSSLNGSVKLIAITGYGRDEDRERTREAGFAAHLVKPVEFSALQRVLAETPAS